MVRCSVAAVIATACSALLVSAGVAAPVNDSWNVRSSWSKTSRAAGAVYAGYDVKVWCYHDGGWAYGTNRWFLITYYRSETSSDGRVHPVIGYLSAAAINRSAQPKVPQCVKRSAWAANGYGPPGGAVAPAPYIASQAVWGDFDGDGTPDADEQPAPAAPSAPAPAPAPAPEPTAPAPAYVPAPAPTWPETVGGNAHTWTNYTNAGGTEGPVIPAYTTVQIACKITGFRVADGNTWWYRIAQAPWSGNFYVSADAFYNNGQTSGSLRGTPFVDPNVANC